jgi:hypothetical protein
MFRRIAGAAVLGLAFIALLAAQQITDNSVVHNNPAVGGPKYKKDKVPTSRSLRGTVTDDTGQPMAGALVTLTDDSTKEKITFITKKDGKFNFDDLSFNKDYEVVARFQSQVSSPRKLSQYDHTADIVRILQLQDPNDKTSQTSSPK